MNNQLVYLGARVNRMKLHDHDLSQTPVLAGQGPNKVIAAACQQVKSSLWPLCNRSLSTGQIWDGAAD